MLSMNVPHAGLGESESLILRIKAEVVAKVLKEIVATWGELLAIYSVAGTMTTPEFASRISITDLEADGLPQPSVQFL